MKKILSGVAAVAMFMATTTPAMAWGWTHPAPVTSTVNSVSFQGNDLHVSANTGKNVLGGVVGTGVIMGATFGPIANAGGVSQSLTTGTAGAQGQQIVQLSPSGCTTCQNTVNSVQFNNNHIGVSANSGKNILVGGVVTGTYHSMTGGIANFGGVSQGVSTGDTSAIGNQWVITGITGMQ